jgi:hypothetical protein
MHTIFNNLACSFFLKGFHNQCCGIGVGAGATTAGGSATAFFIETESYTKTYTLKKKICHNYKDISRRQGSIIFPYKRTGTIAALKLWVRF